MVFLWSMYWFTIIKPTSCARKKKRAKAMVIFIVCFILSEIKIIEEYNKLWFGMGLLGALTKISIKSTKFIVSDFAILIFSYIVRFFTLIIR